MQFYCEIQWNTEIDSRGIWLSNRRW